MSDLFEQATVLSAFQSLHGGPARLFRAPARINIIGEHTDYNDGLVMPANLDLYTWLAMAPRDDRIVRMHTVNFDDSVHFSLDDLMTNSDGGWQEYAKAVMHVLQLEGFKLRGADIVIAGEVPLSSGLSSSAALETVVGYAMLSSLGKEVDRHRLALMCQQAENDYVGVSCGIMDQYVISVCRRKHAMMLDCRSLAYELAPLPDDARILVINSGVQRRLRDGSYNNRRIECEQATIRLAESLANVKTLRDVSREQLDCHRAVLGDKFYRRSKHVITENERVRSALQAMIRDDMSELGKVMTASHESLRTDFEVSCDELDFLVARALNCSGVYGSRMVGAGFGGCTVTVVDPDHVDQAAEDIRRAYERQYGTTPWHHVLGACDPVHELQVN
jgi:galactokinase